MDKFTIMLVPSDGKAGKTFQISKGVLKALPFVIAIVCITMSYFSVDYYQMQKREYDNDVVFVENQHLKENITLLQIKMNSLSEQLERIHVFEKKIRSLTGLDKDVLSQPYMLQETSSNEAPVYEQLFKKEYRD